MKPKTHTKETIVRDIRLTAGKLGHVPTGAGLRAETGVSRQGVLRNFPSFQEAVRRVGYIPRPKVVRLGELVLLEAWGNLARKLGRLSSKNEYARRAKFSIGVFNKRIGRRTGIPRIFLASLGCRKKCARVSKIVRTALGSGNHTAKFVPHNQAHRPGAEHRRKLLPGRPAYSTPLDFRSMRFEPTNEGGVVFLFGALAADLKFNVESIRPGFPDCEALREQVPGRWQRVRIEFEYLSRNFLRQGHSTRDCDLIVCWRHNWRDCPLEVIELASVITKLR